MKFGLMILIIGNLAYEFTKGNVIMVTLFRWYLMKKKEIKLKLGIYTLLENRLEYLAKNSEDLEQRLVHELAEIIHNSNKVNTN